MGEISDTRSKPRSDIICLEGNGARPSHRGQGWSVGGVMYTLNIVEVHSICYEIKDDNNASSLSERNEDLRE